MMERVNSGIKKQRYGGLDSIRGVVLVSMILYHACWDLVYIFNVDFDWYFGTGAYIWQQSICWTFIFLSGFCWLLGKKPFKRGLMVFGGGAVVSAATVLFMPEERVVFGVLTFIGSCMVLMIPFHKAMTLIGTKFWRFKHSSAVTGLLLSIVLFLLARNMNDGYLGFEKWNLMKLPGFLYHGRIMTFIGFPDPAFYSADYFSLFPWMFLFMAGYFLFRVADEKDSRKILNKYFRKEITPFAFLGRNSLIIYLLHQPLIYGILLCQQFSLSELLSVVR